MNKRGFSLVELLAVITIIAIIAVITIPVVTKTINHSKQSIYDRQKEAVERASENWFLKYGDELDENHQAIVTLQYLINQGYLKDDQVTNSKTGESLTGCVVITYSSNQYQYNFSENNCSCSTNCQKYGN